MSDLKIDLDTMKRLAGALSFVAGPNDKAVIAMRAAVESGDEKDVKNARTLFLRVNSTHRNAALAMLMDDD
jgi:hypothetical protein